MSGIIFGQTFQSSIKDKITYTFQDGYKIDALNNWVFDRFGILWMTGSLSNINKFQLERNEFIIQRYDGLSFHDFILPIQKDQKGRIDLMARKDGILYVRFFNEHVDVMYRIDPETLECTEIQSFVELASIQHNIQFFPFEDEVLVIKSKHASSDLYRLTNDDQFILLNTIKSGDQEILFFSDLFEFEDHILFKENWNGVYTISKDGILIKINNIPGPNGIEKKGKQVILNRIKIDGVWYVQLEGIDGYLAYDPIHKTFLDPDGTINLPIDEIKEIIQDSTQNLALIAFEKNGFRLHRQLKEDPNANLNDDIFLPKQPRIISRDIKKELVIATDAKIEHLYFKNSQINSYLQDYSIRAISQKSAHEFMVGTEGNGWFELNTNSGVTRKLSFRPPIPTAPLYGNRAIFKTSDGYFSNNPYGIIHINDQTKQTTSYVYYPVSDMVEDQDFIYYGTIGHKLMKFNKATRQNIPLADTDTLSILGLKQYNGVLYAATNAGILEYKNGFASVYKANDVDKSESDFISIYADDDYGVLVSNRSGKVYQFDAEKKTFKVFYNDKLQASVATILVDDQKTLWLNTFAGIVAYDPVAQTEVRYAEKDGMSHFECNRYSSLKTTDGRFFVGTIKGLNVFSPEKLSQTSVVGQPTFLSISYYDHTLHQWIKETSPARMRKSKQIVLPPTQRRLAVEVGMLGVVNNHEIYYKYQLSKKANSSEWNETPNHQISFANLAKGSYNLQVKAYSPIQGDIGEPIQLTIISRPFFYETWWFRSLLFFSTAGLLLYYYNQFREKQRLQTQLTQNLIIGQEEERARLSRELHDGIGQQLILLMRKSQSNHQPELRSMAGDVLDDLRNITKNLHPSLLNRLGLTETLHQMINGLDEHTAVFFTVQIDQIDNLLTKAAELNVYRFVQECLNNVIKHADAKAVSIELAKLDKQLHLEIRDNGKGFKVTEQLGSSYSLGLQTLYERIKILGGKLDIKSEEAKGTHISAIIPLSKRTT